MSSVFPALLQAAGCTHKSTPPRTTILRVHYTLPCTLASLAPGQAHLQLRLQGVGALSTGANGRYQWGTTRAPNWANATHEPEPWGAFAHPNLLSFAGWRRSLAYLLAHGQGMRCVLAFVWMRVLRLLVIQGRKCSAVNCLFVILDN